MSKPLLTQHDRERALFRYRNAMLRADFDTVAKILHLAERDAVLWQMLSESHEQDDDLLESDTADLIVPDITYTLSSNGASPKTDSQEDKIMNIAISNQRVKPYPRILSSVAAALLLLVFGMVLVTMLAIPIGNNFGQIVQLTQAPLKAGCQLTTTIAVSEESLRLAQAADEVLEGDEADTELAGLLAICALQTDYTPEADVALQRVMSINGTVRSFLGNGGTMGNSGTSGIFSPDGRYLVTSDNGLLRLWDAETGTAVREMAVPTEYVSALAFSPDGRYILFGGVDYTVRMLEVETGQVIRQFLHTHWVRMVAFSPDGRIVLTVDDGHYTVHLWDAETGEEIRQLTGHTSDVIGSAFSPDSRYVATASSDTTVRLWDVSTGEEVRQYPRHTSFATHVAFSADGKYLLNSGGYAVRLADVESGETIREYTVQGTRVFGSPAFSPDGRYVLASDRDRKLALLWDTETGELLRIFDGRRFDPDVQELWRTNFSPDGRAIVMENANPYYQPPYNRIWLWETDYRDTIADACRGISRDFTVEERAQYGLHEGVPTCPQFAEGYALEPGMTSIPIQPIPVWTPLPTLESTGG